MFRKSAALKKRRNRFIFLLATLGVINVAGSNMFYLSQYTYESLSMSVPIEPLRSRLGAVNGSNAGLLGYLEAQG